MKTIKVFVTGGFAALSFCVLPFSYVQAANPAVSLGSSNPNSIGCVDLPRTLSLNAKDKIAGGDVSVLQAFLKNSGFLTATPTGFFGKATFAAVQKFQIQNGFSAVGAAGPATRAKIKLLTCQTNSLPVLPVTAGSISSSVASSSISFLFPKEGAVLDDGKTDLIGTLSWTASPNSIGSFDIALVTWSKDFLKTIAKSLPAATRSFDWKTDPSIQNGTYRILITAHSSAGDTNYYSGAFSIANSAPISPHTGSLTVSFDSTFKADTAIPFGTQGAKLGELALLADKNDDIELDEIRFVSSPELRNGHPPYQNMKLVDPESGTSYSLPQFGDFSEMFSSTVSFDKKFVIPRGTTKRLIIEGDAPTYQEYSGAVNFSSAMAIMEPSAIKAYGATRNDLITDIEGIFPAISNPTNVVFSSATTALSAVGGSSHARSQADDLAEFSVTYNSPKGAYLPNLTFHLLTTGLSGSCAASLIDSDTGTVLASSNVALTSSQDFRIEFNLRQSVYLGQGQTKKIKLRIDSGSLSASGSGTAISALIQSPSDALLLLSAPDNQVILPSNASDFPLRVGVHY